MEAAETDYQNAPSLTDHVSKTASAVTKYLMLCRNPASDYPAMHRRRRQNEWPTSFWLVQNPF
jgi:hypothetical protein